MSEIDPVILQLRADVNKYLSDLATTTTRVDQMLGRQESSVKHLEVQMGRSTDAIKGHLRGLAGGLAGLFSAREIAGLLDNFTRLQNSLKVAGLEGDQLKQVQDALFVSAQKNGVAINTLADLYGKAAASQKELNASQGQLLKLTDLTAKALLITGTSTEQAGGAILGLGQALGNTKLQAEEFNQINEGGLRPLLQAAAAGERFGGSVSKLRQAVVDGKVSNKEFFDLILRGAKDIESKAGKATLTLAAGFNALTNSLTVYFGEADKANGVSAALGIALGKLADNLNTIIPALAAIAVAIGVKYAGSLALAAAGHVALTAAQVRDAQAAAALSVAMQAQTGLMLGNAAATTVAARSVTALSVAQGVAARGGAALLALIGGPIGAAVLALGAGFYFMSSRIEDSNVATGAYAKAQAGAAAITTRAADAAEKLATAHGKARAEALALARAEAENIKQKLASARASVLLAQSELARAKASSAAALTRAQASLRFGGDAGALGASNTLNSSAANETRARANLDEATKTTGALEKALTGVTAAINAAQTPAVAAVGAGKKAKEKKEKGASGPSASEIGSRFNDELVGYAQRILSARGAMASNAEEEAEYAGQSLEQERIRTRASIKENKDYSAVQKSRLLLEVDALAEAERAQIQFEKNRRLEQEAQQLADDRFNAERDALQVQLSLADTQAERKRIALQILAAEQEHLRAVLQTVIQSKTANDADKQSAQVGIDALNAGAEGQRASTSRQNETDVERYRRGLNKTPEQINEAIDGIKIDGLDALNSGLVDALTGVKSLGDVFSSVAKQIIADLLRIAIQKTIVNSLGNVLFGGGSSPGGSAKFNAAFAGFTPGRASGGRVDAGTMYRINEGASAGRVEGFVPQTNGQIVPLGRMNAPSAAAQAPAVATVHLQLTEDLDGRIVNVAGPIAIEVTRANAGAIADQGAAKAIRAMSRPRM